MNGAERVFEFIKKCGYCFLATCDGNQARVRGFGTGCVFEGKYYVQTGKFKNVYKQIVENPNVEIIAYDGKDWLRVAGTLINDGRLEAKKQMMETCPRLNARYTLEDDNNQVFYLENATAKFCTDAGMEEINF